MLIIKIHNDAQHQKALERIHALKSIPDDDHRIYEFMHLTRIVDAYEREKYPLEHVTPRDMLVFMMEQKNLKQRDLMPYLGSEGMVSLILSGKRGIAADKIIPLAKFLGIPPTSLLPRNELVV